MIDKEVAELRRRFRQDRTAITRIYGCYINQFAEIVATFDDSLTMLPVEEQEKYLDLLKKGVCVTREEVLLRAPKIENGNTVFLGFPEITHRIGTELYDYTGNGIVVFIHNQYIVFSARSRLRFRRFRNLRGCVRIRTRVTFCIVAAAKHYGSRYSR